MVGGRNYNETPFNLATEGERQPGSSFKAFDLAAALEDGISPGSVWTSKQKEFIVPNTRGQERFVVHNDEGAYSGSNTLTGATAFSDNSIFAEVGLKVGTHKIALARPPHGHHHPALDQPRDDDRRPHSRRHAARHGPRVRDDRARRPARSAAADRTRLPRRHPGSRLPRPRAAGWLARRPQPRRGAPRAAGGRRRNRDLDARNGPAVRHRARRRARAVRGGQDRHDVQLRRRLVRRLRLQVHRRRVGRLPRQADPDDHRVQRQPRPRRHLPGAHLAPVHGVLARDRQSPRRTRAGARRRRLRRGRRRIERVRSRLRRPAPKARAGAAVPPRRRAPGAEAAKPAASHTSQGGEHTAAPTHEAPVHETPAAPAHEAPAAPAEPSAPPASGGTGSPTGGVGPSG